MWATLTLMSALSMAPGQAGDLQLSNLRTTFGRIGPTRTDKKFLPGDVYFLSFDIEGLKFDGGNTHYSMKMDLLDPSGKPMFKSLEQETELFAIQGSGRVASDVHAVIQTDTKPGEYTLEVVATDLMTKKTTMLTRKFEVGAKEFGIVRVGCFYDQGGQLGPFWPAPGLGAVGQVLYLHFGVTGFERDAKTKQPKLQLEMRMLDAEGKPTLDKPVTGESPTPDEPVPEQFSVVPLRFPMALTRKGKYTVELKATDLVSKKTATVTYPLEVVDPPK
jgi:hypothetical protein